MTTETDRILQRYRATEKMPDALGRIIAVRRLKPSEQTKLVGMTPELTGFETVKVPDENGVDTGNTAQVSHRLPLQIAASVCEIDGQPIPFPKNRAELDYIYDRLDAEGLAAASAAFALLVKASGAGETQEEIAKN